MNMRTSVGIIGASPAGLILSLFLSMEGIESIVHEVSSSSHPEHSERSVLLGGEMLRYA